MRTSDKPGAFIGAESLDRRSLAEQQKVYASFEWVFARGQALLRDRYRCQRCGKGREYGLEVHHRHTLRSGGEAYELDNLVTLCRRCHRDEHGGT